MVQYTNGATNTTSWSPVPSGNVQGICPAGWHIPTDAEWCTLENYVEAGTDASCNLTGARGTNTGAKLKESGTTHWTSPNQCGTGCNTNGFTALPGGYRSDDGSFGNVGNHVDWWTATEGGAAGAYRRFIYVDGAWVARGNGDDKEYGWSVRCVKD